MMKRLSMFLFWGMMATARIVFADDTYYASLKKTEVNWRTGPGERFPIMWVYQEKGYPVRVLDNYDVWRQVQDTDGTVGWVNKSMLSDRRTLLVQEESNLMDKPDREGRVIAVVQPGTIGKVLRCPGNYKYCLLSFKYENDEIKGWFPRKYTWGIDEEEEID